MNLAELRWKVVLKALEIVVEVRERGRAMVRRGRLTPLLGSISDCEDSLAPVGSVFSETVGSVSLSIIALLGKKCLSGMGVSFGN